MCFICWVSNDGEASDIAEKQSTIEPDKILAKQNVVPR